MEDNSKGFMSHNEDFWKEPSKEHIFKQALTAVEYANKNEVPPTDIIQVWEMIIND